MNSDYRRVIILAKSYKIGQRCIAGIFYDTGEWVRPVSKTETGSIDQRLVQGISLLDIVEIPLKEKQNPPFKYQRENWVIGSGEWRKCGKVDPRRLIKYCANDGLILHNDKEYVEPDYLDRLPSSEWKSLELFHGNVRFVEKVCEGNKNRVVIRDGRGNELNLPVTDEDFLKNNFTKVKGKERGCLITISLGKPWRRNESMPIKCYKLAAGIIELS